MKLWRVTVEYEYIVATNDDVTDENADEVCEEELRKEVMDACDYPEYVSASEVHSEKDVPKDWLDAIPWGESDGKTCIQILDEMPKPPYNDPNQMKFPGFDAGEKK